MVIPHLIYQYEDDT